MTTALYSTRTKLPAKKSGDALAAKFKWAAGALILWVLGAALIYPHLLLKPAQSSEIQSLVTLSQEAPSTQAEVQQDLAAHPQITRLQLGHLRVRINEELNALSAKEAKQYRAAGIHDLREERTPGTGALSPSSSSPAP